LWVDARGRIEGVDTLRRKRLREDLTALLLVLVGTGAVLLVVQIFGPEIVRFP
jgi:hypothetical protein